MKKYIVLVEGDYLYENSGLTHIVKGRDPDKAKIYHYKERAENIATFLGGRVAERL